MRLFKHALLIATATSLIFAAKAEVLIYQSRLTIKEAGRQAESNSSAQEFIIADLDSGEFVTIRYEKADRTNHYSLETNTPVIALIEGSRNRSYTTFSYAGTNNVAYKMDFNRGRNVLQELRTGADVNAPKTFKGTGNSISFNEPTVLLEFFRTATYSAKRTVEANDDELTVEEVTDLLVSELQAKGYVALDEPTISSASERPATSSQRLLDTRFEAQPIRHEASPKD